VNSNISSLDQFIRIIKEKLNIEVVNEYDPDSNFLSVNMYAKTTLDDDFLLNTSLQLLPTNKI